MIRFGPSGNDELFYEQGFKNTNQAPEWLHKMGLSALEINLGHGIRMSNETARLIGEQAKKHNIEISAHAPYYVNLAKDESYHKNLGYVKRSLELLKEMGGRRLVVHAASQGDYTRDVALENTARNLKKLLSEIKDDFLICIETMGNYSRIGNVQEVVELCRLDSRLVPCLDFGHINCLLQGELSTNPDKIREILDYVEKELGREKLNKLHIHWSAIVFGPKGERRHTTLGDSEWNFPFEPLAKYIKEKKLDNIVIISESDSIMAQDALRLSRIFFS